jgi:hypothetical protein
LRLLPPSPIHKLAREHNYWRQEPLALLASNRKAAVDGRAGQRPLTVNTLSEQLCWRLVGATPLAEAKSARGTRKASVSTSRQLSVA